MTDGNAAENSRLIAKRADVYSSKAQFARQNAAKLQESDFRTDFRRRIGDCKENPQNVLSFSKRLAH